MRRAGLLLHPTALPGPRDTGDIGAAARQLLPWLEAAELRIWQVLPLNPVDQHGCPYASASGMAAEPLLLSLDDLVVDGWLTHDELPMPLGARHRVDHRAVAASHGPALARAADRVAASVDLASWSSERPWVQSWALYRALSEVAGTDWTAWPEALAAHDPAACDAAREVHHTAVARAVALQWLFGVQWQRLAAEARQRGIALWGDLPFFVGHHSCDVWAHQHLFRLDSEGQPEVVSGVPPDAFSPLGQRWGHPLYAEAAHRAEQHRWWRARVGAAREAFDTVRIDHFRGLEAVWEIPKEAEDATRGQWTEGPGEALLSRLVADAGDAELPYLAEDLGTITPGVRALADRHGLPGMRILQFGFGGDNNHPYLPHQHVRHSVVYTGTHDNDTTLGWYQSTDERVRDRLRRYLSIPDHAMPWALIVAAWRSVADTAIVPLPDLLGLGSEARFNTPGTLRGNWSWRAPAGALDLGLASRVREQIRTSGRGGQRG
jgi:4-alpha-glucanotransferase